MALGTVVGLQLGVMMLDFVGFVETGEAVLPPFVTVTDWATIGGAYSVLGLVFLGAIRDHRGSVHADGNRSGAAHRCGLRLT